MVKNHTIEVLRWQEASKFPYVHKSRRPLALGNVQISYDAMGEGFTQTVRVPSYVGEGLTKSSYNFYKVAEKV